MKRDCEARQRQLIEIQVQLTADSSETIRITSRRSDKSKNKFHTECNVMDVEHIPPAATTSANISDKIPDKNYVNTL